MFSQKMTLGIMGHYKGGGGGSAGGGSAGSGTVNYPDDMKHMYYSMLGNWGQQLEENDDGMMEENDGMVFLPQGISMMHAIRDAWESNPYDDLFAYDPTAE